MAKIRLKKISEFELNSSVNGFYRCTEKLLKHTKMGDEFLDIIIKDHTGVIGGKLWNNIEVFKTRFNKGDFVAVKGTVLKYRDLKYIDINTIKTIIPQIYYEYGFDANAILNFKLYNDNYWNKILVFIKKIKEQNLKRLVINIYKKNKDLIYNLSSMYLPKESPEKFLSHVNSLCEILIISKHNYKNINFDLLLVISMIYKIGLIHDKITSSKLHILSWEIIEREINLIANFNIDIKNKIRDAILNFNRDNLNQSIKSQESLIIFHLSQLEEKLNYYNNNILN